MPMGCKKAYSHKNKNKIKTFFCLHATWYNLQIWNWCWWRGHKPRLVLVQNAPKFLKNMFCTVKKPSENKFYNVSLHWLQSRNHLSLQEKRLGTLNQCCRAGRSRYFFGRSQSRSRCEDVKAKTCFLLLFSLVLYEEEPEPVKKSTWSRSRSKVDRLRNTALNACYFSFLGKIIFFTFYWFSLGKKVNVLNQCRIRELLLIKWWKFAFYKLHILFRYHNIVATAAKCNAEDCAFKTRDENFLFLQLRTVQQSWTGVPEMLSRIAYVRLFPTALCLLSSCKLLKKNSRILAFVSLIITSAILLHVILRPWFTTHYFCVPSV